MGYWLCTLGDSVYNEEIGHIDMDKIRNNLDLDASGYIERVDNCSFGETVIKRPDSSEFQCQRQHLMVYLKGSKDQLCFLFPPREVFCYPRILVFLRGLVKSFISVNPHGLMCDVYDGAVWKVLIT